MAARASAIGCFGLTEPDFGSFVYGNGRRAPSAEVTAAGC